MGVPCMGVRSAGCPGPTTLEPPRCHMEASMSLGNFFPCARPPGSSPPRATAVPFALQGHVLHPFPPNTVTRGKVHSQGSCSGDLRRISPKLHAWVSPRLRDVSVLGHLSLLGTDDCCLEPRPAIFFFSPHLAA